MARAPVSAKAKSALPAVALDKIALLALSQVDGRAVLGFPDRRIVVVNIGDQVPGSAAVVKQVLPDKLILEEIVPGVDGKQVIWLYKGQGGASGRLVRLSARIAPPEPLQAPLVHRLTNPSPPPDGQKRKP